MIATTYGPVSGTTAPEAPKVRAHRGWLARLRPTPRHHDRPAEVLAVLEHARAIVETGWVQNRWCVEPTAPAPARAGAEITTTTEGTAQACLVGAVALAVRARHPHANLAVDTGPALAYVWDAVHEGRGWRGAAGRSAPHHARIMRMRDLARWNDEPGRTRGDVLAAIDRASAGVVRRTVEPARA